MNYEFNLLHHVDVVDKRLHVAAAAAHKGGDNTPSGPTGRGLKAPYKLLLNDVGGCDDANDEEDGDCSET